MSGRLYLKSQEIAGINSLRYYRFLFFSFFPHLPGSPPLHKNPNAVSANLDSLHVAASQLCFRVVLLPNSVHLTVYFGGFTFNY